MQSIAEEYFRIVSFITSSRQHIQGKLDRPDDHRLLELYKYWVPWSWHAVFFFDLRFDSVHYILRRCSRGELTHVVILNLYTTPFGKIDFNMSTKSPQSTIMNCLVILNMPKVSFKFFSFQINEVCCLHCLKKGKRDESKIVERIEQI